MAGEKKKYGDVEFNDQQMEEFRLVVPKNQAGVKINFFPSQFSLGREQPETKPCFWLLFNKRPFWSSPAGGS